MNSSQAVVSTKLTAAQAEEKFGKRPGMVWDEGLQEFVALGHALVVEQMGRQVDLAENLKNFQRNRDVVIRFVQGEYFEEAKYITEPKGHEKVGDLIPGQLGDYYKVPGSDQKALTKRGASKIMQLFRWSRGAARRVAGEETKEYCSATIEVPIVDHLGRTVGAGIGSCNTAEKAFTSKNAINKYGGWCEWNKEKKELEVKRPPDYRAALHDVTSKATKRATTQAAIVAAALEEIFTVARDDEGDHKGGAEEQTPVYPVARDDEGDHKGGAEEQTPVYPGGAPTFRFPQQIKTKQFAPLAGKLITDESITVQDLTALVQWCKTTSTSDPAALDRLRGAAEEELERRRSESEATGGSVL